MLGRERAHLLHYVVDVLFSKLGVHRQAQDFPGQLLGDRQRARAVPEMGVRLLQVRRQRVVNVACDAALAQELLQGVTLSAANYEQVEDALGWQELRHAVETR